MPPFVEMASSKGAVPTIVKIVKTKKNFIKKIELNVF